jgi:hypothetical protein
MEKRFRFLMSFIAVVLLGASCFSFAGENDGGEEGIPKLLVPGARISELSPCSKCHAYRPVDNNKRKLELFHADLVLKHAGERQWCYDCHEGDKLRLRGGEAIDFEKSYELCGQCHGTIFRDWKEGIHGKRTGSWDGEKLYRLCVSCHDPHQPAFRPLAPMAPPLQPQDIKSGKG